MKSVHTPAYRQMLSRLRQVRTEARLTQAAVARHLGRPQSFVSKCEAGERRIDPTELAIFAKLYRTPYAFFLDDD
jgi:transcriptional regulator with XRE-family HTH domain